MAKRYTFFRTPEGKPYKGADGKHAPAGLLTDLGEKSGLSPEGRAQWHAVNMERFRVALWSSVVVIGPDGEELNEHDANGIAWSALVAVVKRSPGRAVAPLDFLNKSDDLVATFFRKPVEKYVVVSSLSVTDLPAKNIAIGGCTVSRLKARGRRWPLPSILGDLGEASPFAKHLSSSVYRPVKVSTEGRSVHQAVEKALNAVNLLRGLWSLIATRGSWTFYLGHARKPLGVIHTGPIHTLHHPDGRLVDDRLYWYSPEWSEDQQIFSRVDEWPRIEKQRKWALRRMAALEYRQDLEELLIRYAVALDQLNTSVAFLQMWSILEKMTDTVGAKYDETIKRTIWLYLDDSRPIVKDMLEALRYRRNKYVHSGASGQQTDQVAYMVKSFVDPHLGKLIGNPFKLRSLEEYGQFLSLPTDIATLRDRRRKMGIALRVLQKGPAKS